jgi:GDPmannose 4,6-dehydratase
MLLACQSHVLVSFEAPEYTANADAIGTLRNPHHRQKNGSDSIIIRRFPRSFTARSGRCSSGPFYPRLPYAQASDSGDLS